MTRKAVYAGSFDPPTNGHMYMIREGARLFDELGVAVGVNPGTSTTFDGDPRLALLNEITDGMPNVRVDSFEHKYLVSYAADQGAQFILRGLRNAQDFEYERTMRMVNADMQPGISTVFLITPRDLAETSSSFVKSLVGPDGWEAVVRTFVPEPVMRQLLIDAKE